MLSVIIVAVVVVLAVVVACCSRRCFFFSFCLLFVWFSSVRVPLSFAHRMLFVSARVRACARAFDYVYVYVCATCVCASAVRSILRYCIHHHAEEFIAHDQTQTITAHYFLIF